MSAATAAGTRAGLGTRSREAAGGARGAIARHVPALLREAGFRRYWCGQTISMFGDQVSSIALPLVAVLTLRASAAQIGLLAALVWLPSLLLGVHTGVLADRFGHWRALMIVADVGRAVLLASIPVCYALGVLTVWQLYAVALGTGAFSVLFTVCQPTLFVSLVPDDAYLEGNSLLYGSRALSFTGGPSTGRLYTASCLVFTAPLTLVPLAGGAKPVILAMLFAAEFVAGFGVMALDICIGSIYAAVVPEQLMSRVMGAFQAVNYGTRPLGALTGGFLGTVLGLRPTLWIAAIGGMAGFAVLLASPLPRFRLPSGS